MVLPNSQSSFHAWCKRNLTLQFTEFLPYLKFLIGTFPIAGNCALLTFSHKKHFTQSSMYDLLFYPILNVDLLFTAWIVLVY